MARGSLECGSRTIARLLNGRGRNCAIFWRPGSPDDPRGPFVLDTGPGAKCLCARFKGARHAQTRISLRPRGQRRRLLAARGARRRGAADFEQGRIRRLDDGQSPRGGAQVPRAALGPLSGAAQLQRPLDPRRQARLPHDAAPGVLPARGPGERLCGALSRHRFRRHDHAARHHGPHDERAQHSRKRQGARNRHRLRLPVGAAHLSHQPGPFDRNHSRARGAHPRRL